MTTAGAEAGASAQAGAGDQAEPAATPDSAVPDPPAPAAPGAAAPGTPAPAAPDSLAPAAPDLPAAEAAGPVPVPAPIPAPAPAPAPAPSPSPSPSPGRGPSGGLLFASGATTLFLLFVAGFLIYLFAISALSESHAQSAMFKNFVAQLAQGTAPVTPYAQGSGGKQVPLAEGAPVAVLNIPQIGLRDVVVVNGTTSRDLALGPGHVRASALPGQAGVSFLYGKALTYGAPFAHLMRLNRGDRFTVTTGQGTSTYVVESFGTSIRPAPADSANRLVLETAAASLLPDSAVQVSADLVSAPKPNPGDWPAITPQETDMALDSADGLFPLVLWSQALLIAVLVALYAAWRWPRWYTYLLMAPVVIALTWCVYDNLACCLLPNLY